MHNYEQILKSDNIGMGVLSSKLKIKNMLIGLNEIEESTYQMKMKKKQMYLERLIEICEKVVEIKDEKEFIQNPKKYVIQQAKIKTGLGMVKEDEFLRLVDLPINLIDKTFEEYESFNVDLFAPVPSFEIHTTNKAQEVEFKALLGLCKELNLYKHPLPLQLQFQFNGDILFKGSEWIPNYNKIMLI